MGVGAGREIAQLALNQPGWEGPTERGRAQLKKSIHNKKKSVYLAEII